VVGGSWFACGCALFIACAAVAGPGRALAQPADELVAEGIALREAGHDERALALFRRAYDRSRSVRALTQIALAEQALGRWVEAERDLERALRSTDTWIEQRRDLLERELARMRSRLGSLRVEANVPNATLRVSDRTFELARAKPVRVVAGEQAIEVRADGYLPVRRTVRVPAGGLARESVHLLPAGGSGAAAGGDFGSEALMPDRPPGPSPSEPGGRDADRDDRGPGDDGSVASKWWFWTLVVGIAAGGAAVALALTDGADDPTYAPSDVGGVVLTLGRRR
jgi:hypothetical protein